MQNTEYQTYPFGTIPKRLNDFFTLENRKIVGRTEELAQVRRDLLAGHATVLVNGIGGIGKTTIARKYVERHWDDYQHIAWLTVNAPQSVGHDPHRAAADEGYSPLRDAFLRSPALWRSLGIEAQVERYLIGPSHQNITLIHNNLAMVHSYAGKYSLAMKHYIEALQITERTVGRDHPRYKISLQGLEKARIALGQSIWARIKRLFGQ